MVGPKLEFKSRYSASHWYQGSDFASNAIRFQLSQILILGRIDSNKHLILHVSGGKGKYSNKIIGDHTVNDQC